MRIPTWAHVEVLQAEGGREGSNGCICWNFHRVPGTVVGTRGCLSPARRKLERRSGEQ